MDNRILLMLQLQNQLNDATNGEEWTKGVTKNGKTINWRRCIYMECAEMVDSFGWKHWKSIDVAPDWQNHQIEVVDVWHFILSLAIELYAKNFKGSIEDIAIDISALDAFSTIKTDMLHYAPQEEVIEKIENLIAIAVSKDEIDLGELVSEFFDLVSMSGLHLDALYRLYVGKNILNQFRQDHGYKEGSYVKIWNGDEDNVVMKRIWEETSNITPDLLYKKLEKAYLACQKS